LVHCHTGCTQQEVIAALRERGLWPEATRTPRSATQPPDREFRAALECAEYWRVGLLELADETLEAISPTDPHRRAVTDYARQVREAAGFDLVTLFRDHRGRHPKMTAALIRVARRRNAQLQKRLGAWVKAGMHGAI
jgi:hypothetical protein